MPLHKSYVHRLHVGRGSSSPVSVGSCEWPPARARYGQIMACLPLKGNPAAPPGRQERTFGIAG